MREAKELIAAEVPVSLKRDFEQVARKNDRSISAELRQLMREAIRREKQPEMITH